MAPAYAWRLLRLRACYVEWEVRLGLVGGIGACGLQWLVARSVSFVGLLLGGMAVLLMHTFRLGGLILLPKVYEFCLLLLLMVCS